VGKEGLTAGNLDKMQDFRFGSSSFRLSARNIKSYGSLFQAMDRDIDFDSKMIEHSYLKVDSNDQDKGAVKKMFKALMGKDASGSCLYKKMGLNKAHVHGALDGGGYAWPKFGFYYDSKSSAQSHQSQIKSRVQSAVGNSLGNPQALVTLQNYCSGHNVKLPNADGTFAVRAFTAEDHAAYLKEHNTIMKHVEDNKDVRGGYLLTNMHTPMMNAVHAEYVKNKVGDDKRPTFLKAIIRGTDMYGNIDLNNAKQMAHVRDYIGG
jgi:hypothetical protein